LYPFLAQEQLDKLNTRCVELLSNLKQISDRFEASNGAAGIVDEIELYLP
jgi:hypothetical protein